MLRYAPVTGSIATTTPPCSAPGDHAGTAPGLSGPEHEVARLLVGEEQRPLEAGLLGSEEVRAEAVGVGARPDRVAALLHADAEAVVRLKLEPAHERVREVGERADGIG